MLWKFMILEIYMALKMLCQVICLGDIKFYFSFSSNFAPILMWMIKYFVSFAGSIFGSNQYSSLPHFTTCSCWLWRVWVPRGHWRLSGNKKIFSIWQYSKECSLSCCLGIIFFQYTVILRLFSQISLKFLNFSLWDNSETKNCLLSVKSMEAEGWGRGEG